MFFPAFVAPIDGNAIGSGTAVDDGINGLFMLEGQMGILGDVFITESAKDLGNGAHHHTSLERTAGLCDGKQVPVLLEDVHEEELDAGITDAHGSGTPSGNVLSVDEVVEQFVFRDEIGTFVVMFDQLTHGAQIRLSRSLTHAVDLHGFIHF